MKVQRVSVKRYFRPIEHHYVPKDSKRIYDKFKDFKIPLNNTTCYGNCGNTIELRDWDQNINEDILFLVEPKGEGVPRFPDRNARRLDEDVQQFRSFFRTGLSLFALVATRGNPILSIATFSSIALGFEIFDYYDSLSLEKFKQPFDLEEFNFVSKGLNTSLDQLGAGGDPVPELFGEYRYKAPRIYQNATEDLREERQPLRINDLTIKLAFTSESEGNLGLKALVLIGLDDFDGITIQGGDRDDLEDIGFDNALELLKPPEIRGVDSFSSIRAFYGTRYRYTDITRSSTMQRLCSYVVGAVSDLRGSLFDNLVSYFTVQSFKGVFRYSLGKGPINASSPRVGEGEDSQELSDLEIPNVLSEETADLEVETDYDDGRATTREDSLQSSLFIEDLTDATFIPFPFPTSTSLPSGVSGEKYRYLDGLGYKGAYDTTINCTKIDLQISFGILNNEDITESFTNITLREQDYFLPLWFDLVINVGFDTMSEANTALSTGNYSQTTYSDLSGFENKFLGTTLSSDSEAPDDTLSITEIGTGTVTANSDIINDLGNVYKAGKAIKIDRVVPPEDPTPDDGMEYEPTEEELMNGISFPVSDSFTKLFFEVDITTLDSTNTFIEVFTGTKKALFEVRGSSFLFVPETGDSIQIATFPSSNTRKISFEIDGSTMKFSGNGADAVTYTVPFTDSTDDEKINLYTTSQISDAYIQNVRYNLAYTETITDGFLEDSSYSDGVFTFRFPTVTMLSETIPELSQVVQMGSDQKYYVIKPNDKLPIFIVASKIRQDNSNLYKGGEWNISDITGFTADSDYYYSVLYPSLENIQFTSSHEFNQTLSTVSFPKNSQAEDIRIYRVKYSDLYRSGSQAFPSEAGDLIEYGDNNIAGTNYVYTYLSRIIITALRDSKTGGEAQATIKKEFLNFTKATTFQYERLLKPVFYEYKFAVLDTFDVLLDVLENAFATVIRIVRSIFGGDNPIDDTGDVDTNAEREAINEYYQNFYQTISAGLQSLNQAIQDTYNEYFSINERHFNQATRLLEKVTFLCKRSIPDYFTSGNPFIFTKNPSNICLYIINEYVKRTNLYDSLEDVVDMDSFIHFRDFCATNEYEFNGVFDFSTNVFDALRSVAICGRSYIDFSRGRFRIITSEKKTVRSAIFSSRNLNDFTREVFKREKPDALKGIFINKNKRYVKDEVLEYFEGKDESNTRDIRNISLFGITDPDKVRDHLRFLISEFESGQELFIFNITLLNLVLERNDLIGINHELIEGDQVTFRVLKRLIHENTVPNDPLDGYIDGVIADQKNFPDLDFANNEYMIQVVTNDGTTHNIDIDRIETVAMEDETHDNMETSTGDQALNSNNEVLLLTPLQYKSLVFKDSQLPNLFQEGNICYFGRKTTVFKDCLILSIESTGSFEARITATPQI